MSGQGTGVFAPDTSGACALPFFLARVPAGFPSLAEDFIEARLDLNRHLIKNTAATFFVRATGDSMVGAGIHNGDLLIVDRSQTPADRAVVVAILDGEFTVKRLRKARGRVFLVSENPNYKPIAIEEGTDFEIWGVVTSVVHRLAGV